MKISGFLQNISLGESQVSATRNLLNLALASRVSLNLFDVEIYGILYKLMIIKNFSPSMAKWRLKFHLDTDLRKFRSLKANRIAKDWDELPDATLQIGSEFNLAGIDRLKGIPKFSYHDSNLHAYLKGAWALPNAKRHIAKALSYEKSVYDSLTGIFTMSDYLRGIFIEDFKLPDDKVVNIGVGYNFPKISASCDRSYDHQNILFIARHLFEQKGGRVLLEAFKEVKKEFPSSRLFLVGQDLNINIEGVECVGFLDKRNPKDLDKLNTLFSKCSLFVMPTFYDAFGVVFLEAMAHGIPCIGANCCAMPEIILDNKAGLVIEPGNSRELATKIISLFEDPHTMKEMGENGIQAIKTKYNWDTVGNRAISAIRQMM